MTMKYYLGIDQGGTKTAAAVCDENGNIIGTGVFDGLVTVYIHDTDEVYIKNIRSAAAAALTSAKLSFEDITAVCGCLNGADWDFEYPVLQKNLARAVSCENALIINDCIGAMRGGSANKECAIICAGTGLNAAVRCADGRKLIYGYFIHRADSGGDALGNAALRKIMDAYIGLCPETHLTSNILSYTGHDTAKQLLIDISMGKYDLKPKNIVGCLLNAYRRGDEQSKIIINEFSKSVARYITAGMAKFDILDSDLEVVFSGGIFKDDGVLIVRCITEYIKEQAPNIIAVNARYEPACGAVLTLLDEHYGGSLPVQVKDSFEKSAVEMGLIRNIELKTV